LDELSILDGFRTTAVSAIERPFGEVPSVIHGGKGLKQKIGVCIICRQEIADINEYLRDIEDIANELIIVNATPPPNDPALYRNLGIPIVVVSGNVDSHIELASAVKNVQCEWILMLNAGETISVDHKKKLQVLCDTGKNSAYYVNTERRMAAGELSPYEWMGNLGKYSAPAVQADGYIPCLELRLFRKNHFNNFTGVGDDDFRPIIDSETVSVVSSNIRLTYCRCGESAVKSLKVENHSEEDLKRFQGIYEESIEQYKDFGFLERDAIGYSMVEQKDLPSLLRGLDMGLGNIDLLKFMVHSLIKNGEYSKAIEFADAISKKIGEHIELWRLKGTAHFYMLELADAEKCFIKALSFNVKDSSLLSNLTKVCIISDRFYQARQWLDTDIAVGGITSELEFIRHLLIENKGRTATLSALILCRDEEKYIGRALDSIRDIVDEIVIVDTGSQDRTVDIAREYGATVVSSDWKDDFAKARNDGLQRVTSDYVLCLDADEYLEIDAKMSLLVFKHILPSEKGIAIALDIHTLTEEHDKNRASLPPMGIERRTAIFPNLPGVCYSGRIFEQIDNSLDHLDINRIVANNTHISHKSGNMEFRNARKSSALEKSFSETMSISAMFEGINYWIDRGELEQGIKWFDRAVKDASGNKQYLRIICRLIQYFDQHGYIDVRSPLFSELVSRYSNSHKVMTICADLFYRQGEYNRAAAHLRNLTIDKDRYHFETIEKEDRQLNLLNLAMINLESGDFNRCDQTLSALSADKDMADAVQAINFYYKLKKTEIDQAISILDAWIRERNLPIKGTIDSFIDLLSIIADVAEKMFQYGQINAGKVLIRASEYLAEKISVKE
jgi:glycosyltransferase involved in cell wall biosynthesis